MTISIEKLKELQNRYKETGEIDEFISVLNEIKCNPLCIFDKSITLANEILSLLINTMHFQECAADHDTIIALKCSVLDIFIYSMSYPEITWFINEKSDILSILFNELHKNNDLYVIVKIINCLVMYLSFERNEKVSFGFCEEPCCESGLKKVIDPKVILSACCDIVKLCLKQVNESIKITDHALVLLNLIYRHFNLNLSPESCGDSNMYDVFRKFLLSVFESKKYSSLCVINALSCFIHCRDLDSNKCFNDNNGKYTLTVIYDTLIKRDQIDEFSPSLHAIALLIDMLQQPSLVDLIRRVWTIDHFKTICKLLIGDFPSIYYEMVLNFFLSIKNKVPEWNNCLYRFLHTNSKLFTFVNQLTIQESDGCSIMAWKLLKEYFKPSEVSELYSHEYLTAITNSVKCNIEKTFFSNKYVDFTDVLIDRRHLKLVKRCQESVDFLVMLLDSENLTDKLISVCVNSKILSVTIALSSDLMDTRHNGFLALQPYKVESMDQSLLCLSDTWFSSAARLVVSLMFLNVSMSQLHPEQICTLTFEHILKHSSFDRLLALSMTYNVDTGIIEKSLALVTYCTRLSDYDISQLSTFIQINNKFLSSIYRSFVNISENIIDHQLSTMMKSHISLNEMTHCQKHRENIDNIVESWLKDNKVVLKSSDTVSILEDYIRSLKEHQNSLELSIVEKDHYIRFCNDNVDQYRIKARNNDVTVQRLMCNIRSLNESNEEKANLIVQFTDKIKEFERKLSAAENLSEKKGHEIKVLKDRLEENEEKLKRVGKDLEGSEELNNQLRSLLTKSESENRVQETEIKKLKEITETIQSLFHRN